MKLLFSSADAAQVKLVQSRLEAAEIPCEVRQEMVSEILPLAPFQAEVWVMNEEDYETARGLLEAGDSSCAEA
jgi:hypothetical protein